MEKTVRLEFTPDELQAILEMKYLLSAMLIVRRPEYESAGNSILYRTHDALSRIEDFLDRYGLKAFEKKIANLADKRK
jgi:hypothetical protein